MKGTPYSIRNNEFYGDMAAWLRANAQDNDGVLRGLIADGIPVRKGMKSGDVDPRAKVENCYTVSDKASAIAGGVLEAILHKMPLTDRSLHMDMEGTL